MKQRLRAAKTMKFMKPLLILSLLINIIFISFWGYRYFVYEKTLAIEQHINTHLEKQGLTDYNIRTSKNYKLQEPLDYLAEVRLYDDPMVYQFYVDDNTVKVLDVQDTDGVFKTLDEVKARVFNEDGTYLKRDKKK
ncbi:hypothetical protein [Macrococcus armenti]|uniref:DUF3139 domain-containing protein n=1 Tax=Macrococcus armenti TaxID=2875764 RepID=A0ABY3ZX12_9STAP|nr:hypothetical protein [Macrococcus armenti]UOB20889.1 hypothetical protein MRZ06_02070 [Macrococcus armenti]